MKTIAKILTSGVIATVAMTFYIAKKSRNKQKYLPPVLLNKLIDRTKFLPDINQKETHPAGWMLHFMAGISFVIAYRLLWKDSLLEPSVPKVLILGSASGAMGVGIWKLVLSEHHRPPQNNRLAYYRKLFLAHMIFSVFAMKTYQLMSGAEKK